MLKKVVIGTVLIALMIFVAGCGSSSTTDTPNATDETARIIAFPVDAESCTGIQYSDIAEQLEAAGFTNIITEKTEDLNPKQKDVVGTISTLTVDGKTDIAKGQEISDSSEIVITYHGFAKCNITVHVNFFSNLLFNKYDVDVFVDSVKKDTLEHGEDKDFTFQMYPGTHTIEFAKDGDSDVNGSIELNVQGDINISLEIDCKGDHVNVTTVFIEDTGALEDGQSMLSVDASEFKNTKQSDIEASLKSFGFTNINLEPSYDCEAGDPNIGVATDVVINGTSEFKRGDIYSSDVKIEIKYHEDMEKDPIKIEEAQNAAVLEKSFPKEIARKVVVVAMTNGQATDVFAPDGNTLDQSKFHSYSDISGFFLTVERDGTWSAVDTSTWQVDNIIMRIYDYDTRLKATGKVKKDGDNYIFFNVDRAIVSKDKLDDPEAAEMTMEHYEPSDFNCFLTVPSSLISEERDNAAANKKMTAKEERHQWIVNQFNWWDGRHEALSELIKDNLNDSKSFKHVDANYIDISDEETQKHVNNILKDSGFSTQVNVGDLFVMEEFTAKNAFNATIRNTGYGIVRENGTVILLGIA